VGVMHKPKLAKLKRRGSNVLNDGQRIVSSFFSKTSRSKERSSIGVSIFFLYLSLFRLSGACVCVRILDLYSY
jgi:hypothetical protein